MAGRAVPRAHKKHGARHRSRTHPRHRGCPRPHPPRSPWCPPPAPTPVAERLRVPPGADVFYIERLRRLNGLPLSLDLTYVPLDIGTALIGTDLENTDLENTDVFRLLEAISGQPLGHAEITLEAVNADAHSATVLQAPRGAAVLMFERLTHLADGRPVDLEFIRFRGDRITMSGLLHRSL